MEKVINVGNKELRIRTISESWVQPTDSERGSFAAHCEITIYDGNYPVRQSSKVNRMYFDKNYNVYSTNTSKRILFNLKS
jgi:hypothetical protein|nr:MAG TPA: hypothetical protein [Caudoviricetes sp.]